MSNEAAVAAEIRSHFYKRWEELKSGFLKNPNAHNDLFKVGFSFQDAKNALDNLETILYRNFALIPDSTLVSMLKKLPEGQYCEMSKRFLGGLLTHQMANEILETTPTL
jgi:hypothetical protein